MSGTLDSRVEVLKLARLLGIASEELGYLEAVPAGDLRKLREKATDRLFDLDAQVLQRLASASRLLPIPVLVAIGERAFGPLLCARMAGRIDPGRGVEIAARLSTEFLADVAVELDPRRASEIVARIPPERIVEITRVLVERKEYVAMGRFVGHLDEERVIAALGVIGDASLLRVLFVLEGKQRLSKMAGLLPDERVPGLVRAAEDGLEEEALDLLSHLTARQRARFEGLAAARPR